MTATITIDMSDDADTSTAHPQQQAMKPLKAPLTLDTFNPNAIIYPPRSGCTVERPQFKYISLGYNSPTNKSLVILVKNARILALHKKGDMNGTFPQTRDDVFLEIDDPISIALLDAIDAAIFPNILANAEKWGLDQNPEEMLDDWVKKTYSKMAQPRRNDPSTAIARNITVELKGFTRLKDSMANPSNPKILHGGISDLRKNTVCDLCIEINTVKSSRVRTAPALIAKTINVLGEASFEHTIMPADFDPADVKITEFIDTKFPPALGIPQGRISKLLYKGFNPSFHVKDCDGIIFNGSKPKEGASESLFKKSYSLSIMFHDHYATMYTKLFAAIKKEYADLVASKVNKDITSKIGLTNMLFGAEDRKAIAQGKPAKYPPSIYAGIVVKKDEHTSPDVRTSDGDIIDLDRVAYQKVKIISATFYCKYLWFLRTTGSVSVKFGLSSAVVDVSDEEYEMDGPGSVKLKVANSTSSASSASAAGGKFNPPTTSGRGNPTFAADDDDAEDDADEFTTDTVAPSATKATKTTNDEENDYAVDEDGEEGENSDDADEEDDTAVSKSPSPPPPVQPPPKSVKGKVAAQAAALQAASTMSDRSQPPPKPAPIPKRTAKKL